MIRRRRETSLNRWNWDDNLIAMEGRGIFLASCLKNLSNCQEDEDGTRDGQVSLRKDVPMSCP